MNQNNFNRTEFPSWIRVFGMGKDSKEIIDQIKAENYPDINAIYLTKEIIAPDEDDEMVIFINPSNEEIKTMVKSFYQTGVLTLIISTDKFSFERECYDSSTIIRKNKIVPAINHFLILYSAQTAFLLVLTIFCLLLKIPEDLL